MTRREVLATTAPWLAVTIAGLAVVLLSSPPSSAALPCLRLRSLRSLRALPAPPATRDAATSIVAALSREGPRCSEAGSVPRPAPGSCILETTVDAATTLEVSLVKGSAPEAVRAAFTAQLGLRGYTIAIRPDGELVFSRGDEVALVTVSADSDGTLVTVVMTRRGMP